LFFEHLYVWLLARGESAALMANIQKTEYAELINAIGSVIHAAQNRSYRSGGWLMDEEGYVKGVGWRIIHDIKCTSTKDAEIMDGYYNRRIEGWGYVKTPVRVSPVQ
jgi:hypothetical protein